MCRMPRAASSQYDTPWQQIRVNELRYNRVNRSIVNIIGKVADNENNPQWQSNISELQAVSDSKWFSERSVHAHAKTTVHLLNAPVAVIPAVHSRHGALV